MYMTWKLNYYKWKLTKKKWIFLETWILILLYQLNFTIDFTIIENYWKNYQGECLGCCTMLDSKLLLLSKVESSLKQSPDSPCKTKCGDSGCQCVSNKTLESMDHLLLVSETGHIVTCLCGNYQVNNKFYLLVLNNFTVNIFIFSIFWWIFSKGSKDWLEIWTSDKLGNTKAWNMYRFS